ncbi:hypothetical protein GCM10009677_59640 [Sphaerisporangium rubeum]|uniref:Uncharacterized protein n=1 Tax=Sphaerisporangium rubeum TaxID=321317 RepID=A0A7X0ILC4_9ACTN|nr:hypothetical protein [Sphaerisporangium rubeum]MBB6476128.1 hypothetical protein [Sphaerisporangium rubeum]
MGELRGLELGASEGGQGRASSGGGGSRRERVRLTSTCTTSGTATPRRDAKIDWKALSSRIGHADVVFTMRQYVQTDLIADRQVATALAELILGGQLASVPVGGSGEVA